MKISEMIDKLKEIQEDRGDLEIVRYSADESIGVATISVDYITTELLDYFDFKGGKVITNEDVVVLD